MEAFLAKLTEIVAPIENCGTTVIIFFVFTIIGLIIGSGVVNALRNGLLIAAGFAGVYMVLNYFLGAVDPVALALSERFGSHFTYTDIGWPGFSTIAWGSPMLYPVCGIAIVVNIIMLVLNLTDTLNLDIWDIWHTVITCMVVYAVTENWLATGLVAAASYMISLVITDWFANKGYIRNYFGMDNISYFQGCNVWWTIFAEGCSKLMDKLNIAGNDDFTPSKVQEKWGIIGEPVVIGGVIGLLMGIAAGLPWYAVLTFMVDLAACLLILPMMVGIVVQGLIPFSDGAGAFLQKIYKGKRNLYIGVDVALACGDETVMAVSTIMIPIMLVLFLIVPGSSFIPLADLGSLCYFICWFVAANNGDMVRTLITAILSGIVAVFFGTITAPLCAKAAAFFPTEGYEGNVTSLFLSYDNDIALFGKLAEGGANLAIIGAIVAIVLCVAYRISYLSKKAKSVEAK